MRKLRGPRIRGVFRRMGAAALVAYCVSAAAAQDDVSTVAGLKRLSLEELMEVSVITATRQPEPLYRSASAISVLRDEDIRRSGATNIPDALRLVPGLHVAQQNGRTWAISARGFNMVAANKLEVVFDGRSAYTPFFSGTFWDVQETFLPDIEQIEVVRGPGGTLWGANAVNGVINIKSKSARDTLGSLTIAAAGSHENAMAAFRHGWRVGDRSYARVYGRFLDRDWLSLRNGQQGQPDREFFQAGFRTDSYPDERTQITTQGNIYSDEFGFRERSIGSTGVSGGNLLARLNRQFGMASLEVQGYWDHTERLIPSIFDEKRDTGELSFLLSHMPAEGHNVLWGVQARGSRDKSRNIGAQILVPAEQTLWLFGGLVQDQIAIIPDKLSMVLGSKFEHHTYTGFEIQPAVRIAWNPAALTTLWAAAARAVRTPVRIDRDLVSPASGTPVFRGTDLFDSEKLHGYQVGVRRDFWSRFSLDASAYYNRYHDLRSSERESGPGTPLTFKNGFRATTYGLEIAGTAAIFEQTRLNLGYAYFRKSARAEPGAAPLTDPSPLGNDPRHSAFARLSTDLGQAVSLDLVVRGVSALPAPAVPGYWTSDARFAWRITPALEWSVTGRDLAQEQHTEFGANNPRREEMPRSVYTQVEWRF